MYMDQVMHIEIYSKTANSILVNQLIYAADMLQMTELQVDSKVYRCVYVLTPIHKCLVIPGFPMLISMEQSILKVVSFYVPFGRKTHYLEN